MAAPKKRQTKKTTAKKEERPSSVDEMFGGGQQLDYEVAPETGGDLVPSAPTGVPHGTTVAAMKGAFSAAMKVVIERDIRKVRRKLLEEADLAGDSFFYGWGSGDNAVEGPSQVLAHTVLRLWGNCGVEFGPIQELKDSWIFTAYFVDLETGATLARPFRMSKFWTIYGRFDRDRKMDMRFAIGATKSTRNVVLKAIPEWLWREAMTRAKAGLRKRVENAIKEHGQTHVVGLLLRDLEAFSINADTVFLKYAVKSAENLTLDQVVLLTSDLRALKSGNENVEDVFPPDVVEPDKKESSMDSFAGAKTPEEGAAAGEMGPKPKLGKDAIERILAFAREAPKVELSEIEKAAGGSLVKIEGDPGEADDGFEERIREQIQGLKVSK